VIRRVISTDLAIAVVVAGLVLIISPGLAISGLLAVIVLLICGISLVRERRAAARGPSRMARARPRPPGR
jgi:hypothetical protein